jgi:hypothetical protein
MTLMLGDTHMKTTLQTCAGVLAAAGASFGSLADPVVDANANAAAAALATCIAPTDNPLHESRMYAMMHLAIHDALNAIQRRSRPYAYDATAPAGASPEAAVAAATRDVLVSQIARIGAPFPPVCIAAGIARAEADHSATLAAIPDSAAKTLGVDLGRAAAAAIIARRANDGSDTLLADVNYTQGTAIGEWRFTPGSPQISFATGWGSVTPFALRNAAQFLPPAPSAVECEGQRPNNADGCRTYARDYEEVRRLGSDAVSAPSARTPEQTQIALYWVESSPLAWNRIARTASMSQALDPWENARLFALLNVALTDGYIANWVTRFQYKRWRPVTAIREGDRDNNPLTTGDPNWMSLAPTPPIPEYESGHSLEGAAAAQVLKRVFRRDSIAFSNCSYTLPASQRCGEPGAVLRSYRSFSEAEKENGESRIFVGFHFRGSVEAGLKHGGQVGEWTVDQILRWER